MTSIKRMKIQPSPDRGGAKEKGRGNPPFLFFIFLYVLAYLGGYKLVGYIRIWVEKQAVKTLLWRPE